MQSPLPQLRWLFVDMDSFFASIEQHLRPEFRDQPVGVVPVKSEGTCVIAASRQAKAFGVKTGTRVLDARKLCPEITFLKARPDVYVQIHHAVARSIERCVPIHKAYSIDEWAIELRGSECTPSTALEVGRNIKQSILKDFSPAITCSVGIAPTPPRKDSQRC